LLINWAFVFKTLPISSSLPTQIISTTGVIASRSGSKGLFRS
jgi:hypothetical protein